MSQPSQSVSPAAAAAASPARDQDTTRAASSITSPSCKAEKPYHRIRSCVSCRSRKVKCDRQEPCTGCQRAGAECVYPSGPGRAPKQPRRAIDKRLLDRLVDLESLVRRLEDTNDGAKTEAPAAESEQDSSQVEQQFGRLVIDDTRSCYVSNILWASLGDEVRIIKTYIITKH